MEKEVAAANNKNVPLHRIYLVGTTTVCSADISGGLAGGPSEVVRQLEAFGDECREMIHSPGTGAGASAGLGTLNRRENCTGILLLFPGIMVHILECSEEALLGYLKSVEHYRKGKNSQIDKLKILVISHDIHQRLYKDWSVSFVLASGSDRDVVTSDPMNLAKYCIRCFTGLSVHLHRQTQASRNHLLERVSERASDWLVSEHTLTDLVNSDSPLLDTEQFLQLYNSPISLPEHREYEWPAPYEYVIE